MEAEFSFACVDKCSGHAHSYCNPEVESWRQRPALPVEDADGDVEYCTTYTSEDAEMHESKVDVAVDSRFEELLNGPRK